MPRLLSCAAVVLLLLARMRSCCATDAVEHYLTRVRPLLAEKCASCHGAIRQEAGLRLDAASLIRQGGDSGAAVNPQNADASLILLKVTHADPDQRMPPADAGTPLTSEQITLIREWIRNGAAVPADEQIPASPESHWAWQRPVRPDLPAALDGHPLDSLIRQHWQRLSLQPVSRADGAILVRRLAYDLTGLPPADGLSEALRDGELDTQWAQLVDQFLEDPAYGERWARHWMDVWRYSDWDGYKEEVRGSQRHIWHWRDWIIESLNADAGYDQMIRQMLAADELEPENAESLRATGYLVRSFHSSNRDIWLDAVVDHTSRAFLAMTVHCARCHDHKYDPVSQPEYYAFRAIFEPYHVRTERIPGEPDLKKAGIPRVFDKEPDAKTWLYVGGNEKIRNEDHPIPPGIPDVLHQGFEPQPVSLPPVAVFPALNAFIRAEDVAAAEKALQLAVAARDPQLGEHPPAAADQSDDPASGLPTLRDQRVIAARSALAALNARWDADTVRYSHDPSADLPSLAHQAAALERAADCDRALLSVMEKQYELDTLEDPDGASRQQKADKLQAELQGLQEQLAKADTARARTDAEYTSVGAAFPATSAGRRTALAHALTSPDNPLVARVAVNHIWMHHFGEPLVDNVFDFGMRTPAPPLQDVLDFLAVELMEHNWSMKHLHRLILTSDVWKLSSSGDPNIVAANDAIDPQNQFRWRGSVRRLEAEVIRDAVLASAGSLDQTLGGPELAYEQGEETLRRSLYYQHAYEKQMTLMVTFDAAAPQECYRRTTSIVPQQALALSNSGLVLEQSRVLAERLSSGRPDDSDFIAAAFGRILNRPCTDSERNACQEFLQSQQRLLEQPDVLTAFHPDAERRNISPAQRARENLVHVLFNHNDFVTIR